MVKRLAVLVGCNYTGSANPLHGTFNDVSIMIGLLTSRFGFEITDIVCLTDNPTSRRLPTKANIKKDLLHMAKEAQSGDVLFFFFSGHGDITGGEQAIVTCDNDCLKSETDFRFLVERLKPGVTFTFIASSCNSGGLIGGEKEQQFGPASSATVGNPGTEVGILISACQKNENTVDMEVGKEGMDQGVFPYAINKVMRDNPHKIFTNRELVMEATKVVHDMGYKQHPGLYCSDHNANEHFLRPG